MKGPREIKEEAIAHLAPAAKRVVLAVEKLLVDKYEQDGTFDLSGGGVWLAYQDIEAAAGIKLIGGVIEALQQEAAGKWTIVKHSNREGDFLRITEFDEYLDDH